MVLVQTIEKKGKTLTLPHTEQNGGGPNQIAFDENGFAEVNETQAFALVELFPKWVQIVEQEAVEETEEE